MSKDWEKTGRLLNKVYVVTGASGSVGSSVAKRLMSEGADIIAQYRKRSKYLHELKKISDQIGRRVVLCQGDFSDVEAIDNFAKKVVKCGLVEFGKIDGAFLGAGVTVSPLWNKSATEYKPGDLGKVFTVDVEGNFAVATAIVRVRKNTQTQSLVFMGATNGIVGRPQGLAWVVGKGSVIALTRGLAEEGGPFVRVNCIAPGYIDVPWIRKMCSPEELREEIKKTPLKKLATPEDIASVVAFLLSDDAAHITGRTIIVDGGEI